MPTKAEFAEFMEYLHAIEHDLAVWLHSHGGLKDGDNMAELFGAKPGAFAVAKWLREQADA